jgi:hypothetical protein
VQGTGGHEVRLIDGEDIGAVLLHTEGCHVPQERGMDVVIVLKHIVPAANPKLVMSVRLERLGTEIHSCGDGSTAVALPVRCKIDAVWARQRPGVGKVGEENASVAEEAPAIVLIARVDVRDGL